MHTLLHFLQCNWMNEVSLMQDTTILTGKSFLNLDPPTCKFTEWHVTSWLLIADRSCFGWKWFGFCQGDSTCFAACERYCQCHAGVHSGGGELFLSNNIIYPSMPHLLCIFTVRRSPPIWCISASSRVCAMLRSLLLFSYCFSHGLRIIIF